MKKGEKDKDESVLFRCTCGAPEFFEVSIFDDKKFWAGKPEFFFCVMSEPKNFWERLKHLFKPQHFLKEVIMTNRDVKKLVKVLSRHI